MHSKRKAILEETELIWKQLIWYLLCFYGKHFLKTVGMGKLPGYVYLLVLLAGEILCKWVIPEGLEVMLQQKTLFSHENIYNPYCLLCFYITLGSLWRGRGPCCNSVTTNATQACTRSSSFCLQNDMSSPPAYWISAIFKPSPWE